MEHDTKQRTPASTAIRLEDYEFDLPADRIAQEPLAERDGARLMVLDQTKHERIHAWVRDLPNLLAPGDLLVVNDTQVLPARVRARTATGGQVELLFVRPLGPRPDSESPWLCLGRPARRFAAGRTYALPGAAVASIEEVLGAGRYAVRVTGVESVPSYLQRHGEIPLPPYIARPGGPRPVDHERYQTIFARTPGAIAAPTAGLHFSERLIGRLREREVEIAPLTLHVGPGTFLPIRSPDVRQHRMEPEWCSIPESTAAAIRAAKSRGSRVVAVGTTCTRALESSATDDAKIVASGERWADCFIYPGYRFRVIDALFTNFHLPGSTLVVLVAALVGRDWLLDSYQEAIQRGYRFYSYGDAMLVL